MINRLFTFFSLFSLLLLLASCSGTKPTIHSSSSYSSPLQACANVFVDSQTDMAPTVYDSSPLLPYGSNQQFCYSKIYALEYWGGNHSPRWAAFTLPVLEDVLDECSPSENLSEGIHIDSQFPENNLTADSYENTDFVPGLLVPEQVFENSPCAQYHSRVLTNVSPQHKYLSPLWHDLAEQINVWSTQSSRLYVVTGNAFQNFPYQQFDDYKKGILNHDDLITGGTSFDSISNASDVLKPAISRDILPTAYFALLYRPEQNGVAEQMIGFLLPHTQQDLKLASNGFWSFVAPIETIETTADVYFPSLKSHIKSSISSDWFFQHRQIAK